jgi:AraC-like DNA-binding protein
LYFSDMTKNIQNINSAGITHCEQDWSWDTSRRPSTDHDLWTVFSGRGTLRTQDRVWSLLPGDCFVLQPGGIYRGEHDPDHPLLVIHIHFDPSPGFPLDFHRRLTQLGFLREVLTRSVLNHHQGEPEAALVWLEAAICEIQSQQLLRSQGGKDEGRAEAIDIICRRILESPSAAYRVGKLAKAVSLSPDHFSRMFRKLKGVTPREFILRARIDSAQDLLRSSNHSIGRIAEILGYSDVYFFSRQFKEKVGVTPSAFRK